MKILDLYITDVCNLNCEYCYVDVVKQEDIQFDGEEFVQRIDLLSYDSIKFLGGEPLIRWEDIKNIIEHVSSKRPDIQFSIITNGVLLSQKKVSYILEKGNVELLVSLHDSSLSQIRKKRDIFLALDIRITFYIIFDPSDFSQSLQKFLEFSRYGFKNFCFAPEIYGYWNDENLMSLEKILRLLIKPILKYDITIGGIAKNFLKEMNYGCEKRVFDKQGNYKMCNRFRSLEAKPDFRYVQAYNYFQEHIGFKNDPNRWFYVCPVGWYLDNLEKLDEQIKAYKRLNTIFLDFHREINKGTNNFLSLGTSEIRFNLTRQCNIRCSYCYVDFKNEALEFSRAKNIVDFFIEQEGDEKTFSFFGGEPLLEKKLLEKIVQYIQKKNEKYGKKISYKIATNFMLVDDDIIDFFILHKFEIHISLNGAPEINNTMRDNSSTLLLKKLEKYSQKIDPNTVVILLAFSPNEVHLLQKNLHFISTLGYKRINFELIFGEDIHWQKGDIKRAIVEIYKFSKTAPLRIENISKKKNTFLDIDTKGRCSDNSLEFYGKQVDREHKQYFDTLFHELFNHVAKTA